MENLTTNKRSGNELTILESGASLSRIYNMITARDLDFGIITSFRKSDTNSLKEKQHKNELLLKYFRTLLDDNKAYGAYKLIGHWKECSISLPEKDDNGDIVTIDQCELYGGTIEHSLEESWLIVNDKHNPNFFEALVTTAKEYEQDGFIARIGDNFGVFSKGGDQWEKFKDVSTETISSSFDRLVSLQGYSELKKKRVKGKIHHFVFEGLCIPNHSNSSSMMFHYMNILYKPLNIIEENMLKLRGSKCKLI